LGVRAKSGKKKVNRREKRRAKKTKIFTNPGKMRRSTIRKEEISGGWRAGRKKQSLRLVRIGKKGKNRKSREKNEKKQ